LSVSLGSLAELETQLEIAYRIGYLAQEDFVMLTNELSTIGRQLNVLSQKIRTGD
jgi:four helix bundle protein